MALRTTDAVVRVSARTGRVNQIANPSSASASSTTWMRAENSSQGAGPPSPIHACQEHVVDTGQVDVAAAEQLTEER